MLKKSTIKRDNTSRYGNSNNLRQKTSYNYHCLKTEQ